MEHLCIIEQRPFSYIDFLEFKVDGNSYRMTHGTFRNKISILMKRGKVGWICDSPQGFYIIKGSEQNLNSVTTDDHTGVNLHSHPFFKDKVVYQSHDLVNEIMFDGTPRRVENSRLITNNPLYRHIQGIPFGQRSVHDIRLNFNASGIWDKVSNAITSEVDGGLKIKMSNLQGPKIESQSKDISFSTVRLDNLDIKVRIHKNDKVSVIVGCSHTPVVVDIEGTKRLSNALSLIEKELTRLLFLEKDTVDFDARKNWNRLKLQNENLRASGIESSIEFVPTALTIPRHMDWIVTMWHFGVDSVHEYSGQKFNCRWELAQDIMVSIYTKEMMMQEIVGRRINRGSKVSLGSGIRVERQEYPRVTLGEAIRNRGLKLEEAIGK